MPPTPPREQASGPAGTSRRRCSRAALFAGQAFGQAGEGRMVEWPYYGANAHAQYYSPLDQIDASNAADLRVLWRWNAANFGPRPEARNQSTRLMIDGVL